MINNISGNSASYTQKAPIKASNPTDDRENAIMSEIAKMNEQLRKVNSDKEMAEEEKAEKRKEINANIAMLNQQLRDYKQQKMKEKQEEAASDMNALTGNQDELKPHAKGSTDAIGVKTMTSLIAAEGSKTISKAQGRVATEIEGQMRIRNSEINSGLDKGQALDRKIEEVSGLNNTLVGARSAQVATMYKASSDVAKAVKEERSTDKKDDTKDKDEDENSTGYISSSDETDNDSIQDTIEYTPVDIRL